MYSICSYTLLTFTLSYIAFTLSWSAQKLDFYSSLFPLDLQFWLFFFVVVSFNTGYILQCFKIVFDRPINVDPMVRSLTSLEVMGLDMICDACLTFFLRCLHRIFLVLFHLSLLCFWTQEFFWGESFWTQEFRLHTRVLCKSINFNTGFNCTWFSCYLSAKWI